MDSILEVGDLSKSFGDREAVRSIQLRVSRGEIFGLLGPNGAGKTTTLAMIAGVLRPGGGSIRILGRDAADGRSARRPLGLVPQSISVYPGLTAEENLSFFGRLYGASGPRLRERVDRLLDLSGLTGRRADLVSTFSGGMKRRLNLACGMVHEPALLLLDEPTAGVDPQSRERIYEMLEELASQGLGLVLTTHYMEEAERLCHRVAIMDEGRFVACGTVAELRALGGKEAAIEIRLAREPAAALRAKLLAMGFAAEDPRRFRVHRPRAERFLPELLGEVASAGNSVEELALHRPDLGDVFLHLTGKALRD